MGETIYSDRHRAIVAMMIATRQKASLNQVEMAERLNIHQQRVSDWESGQRRIDVAELHAWCDAVGVDIRDFIAAYHERIQQHKV